MSEVHYIASFAFVEAICHIDFVIEYYKLLKNGKAVRQKLHLFLESVSNPSILTEKEINDFMEMLNNCKVNEKWNFFKNSMDHQLKQKLTGFMTRANCSQHFCSKLTNGQLKNFIFSSSMIRLNEVLLEVFKPVILVMNVSTKSRCNEQVKFFANCSFDDFNVVRSKRFELSRKMNKFEVWGVKDKYQQSLCEKIRSEPVESTCNVPNSANELSYLVDPMLNSSNGAEYDFNFNSHSTDSIPNSSNSVNDLVEYVRSFTEY